MPILTPGQERKTGRRWAWVAGLLVFPFILSAGVYGFLRWGPVKEFKVYRLGSVELSLEPGLGPALIDTPQPPLRISTLPAFTGEHSWEVQVDYRFYWVRW